MQDPLSLHLGEFLKTIANRELRVELVRGLLAEQPRLYPHVLYRSLARTNHDLGIGSQDLLYFARQDFSA